MRTIAIVQARMGSSRLPKKVMKEVLGRPMIGFLLERLSKSNKLDQIVLATSKKSLDRVLASYVKKLGFPVILGSENDVLDRYYRAAKEFKPNNIVRITGDCPLIDSNLIDKIICNFIEKDVDYLSNIWPRTFPKGLDIEVFTFEALERAVSETTNPYDREHVTPYIRESGNFKVANFTNKIDCSMERWTVDWQEDFDLIKKIFESFSPRVNFSWEEILELRMRNSQLFEVNEHLIDK